MGRLEGVMKQTGMMRFLSPPMLTFKTGLPHQKITDFFDEMMFATDRVIGVVAPCILDFTIPRLYKTGGILDFNSKNKKIPIADKTLGQLLFDLKERIIIDENEYNDLRLIKDIRNAFAHELETNSFSTPHVKEKLDKLNHFRNWTICTKLHEGGHGYKKIKKDDIINNTDWKIIVGGYDEFDTFGNLAEKYVHAVAYYYSLIELYCGLIMLNGQTL
jgi:hypothetical protein